MDLTPSCDRTQWLARAAEALRQFRPEMDPDEIAEVVNGHLWAEACDMAPEEAVEVYLGMHVRREAVNDCVARLLHPRLAFARERLRGRVCDGLLDGQGRNVLLRRTRIFAHRASLRNRVRRAPDEGYRATRPLEFCRAQIITRRAARRQK